MSLPSAAEALSACDAFDDFDDSSAASWASADDTPNILASPWDSDEDDDEDVVVDVPFVCAFAEGAQDGPQVAQVAQVDALQLAFLTLTEALDDMKQISFPVDPPRGASLTVDSTPKPDPAPIIIPQRTVTIPSALKSPQTPAASISSVVSVESVFDSYLDLTLSDYTPSEEYTTTSNPSTSPNSYKPPTQAALPPPQFNSFLITRSDEQQESQLHRSGSTTSIRSVSTHRRPSRLSISQHGGNSRGVDSAAPVVAPKRKLVRNKPLPSIPGRMPLGPSPTPAVAAVAAVSTPPSPVPLAQATTDSSNPHQQPRTLGFDPLVKDDIERLRSLDHTPSSTTSSNLSRFSVPGPMGAGGEWAESVYATFLERAEWLETEENSGKSAAGVEKKIKRRNQERMSGDLHSLYESNQQQYNGDVSESGGGGGVGKGERRRWVAGSDGTASFLPPRSHSVKQEAAAGWNSAAFGVDGVALIPARSSSRIVPNTLVAQAERMINHGM
ncbi:hypothetical protein HDU98_006188 [Podochytrium sp. JEL0797]|nr:hypothetical protein HDU98_006188 [Podochytrium sp. JEL0797]